MVPAALRQTVTTEIRKVSLQAIRRRSGTLPHFG
jgi:hypothetical protein